MLSACRLARSSHTPSSDSRANTSACQSAEDHLSLPVGTPSSVGTHSSLSATNYVQSPLCLPCLAVEVLRIRCNSTSCQILLPPFKSPHRKKVIYSTAHQLPTRRGMARSQFCKCRQTQRPGGKLPCLADLLNPHSAHSENTPEDRRFR